MIGPGKYDPVCAQARAAAKAQGVVLMVLGGEFGNGFSVQLPPGAHAGIPCVLRQVAAEIWADLGLAMPGAGIPDHEVIQSMRRYGGDFEAALAETASRADDNNLRRLKEAWPEIWSKYARMTL